jgi:two-component system OmpR family response regulator
LFLVVTFLQQYSNTFRILYTSLVMQILLIEDDVAVSDSLKAGLEFTGHSVSPVYNTAEARAAMAESGFDLILLDLELPDGNGLDLLAELRSAADPIPVIITTARTDIADRVAGLDLGADDYMPKPVDLEELLARIRSITRRAGEAQALRRQVGDLVLELTERQVTRGGKAIDLTQREFDVLDYLMRNKDTVVTKEMLASHVWKLPEHSAPIDNSIAVHMSHLRDKIDKDFDTSLIHTEWGAGYMMRSPSADSSDDD